jgi:hypothetical protein
MQVKDASREAIKETTDFINNVGKDKSSSTHAPISHQEHAELSENVDKPHMSFMDGKLSMLELAPKKACVEWSEIECSQMK